jgi:hypothetical protein
MRAREFIKEIMYSSSIASSEHIVKALNPSTDNNIGVIDHHPVYIMDGGNCIVIYIANSVNQIQSYAIVEKKLNDGYYVLRQLENVAKKSGIIMALLQFLASENIKLIIRHDEPMTQHGLKWIIKLINDPQGLDIHDGSGNPIPVSDLVDEWNNSRLDPSYQGKISIVIESRQNDLLKSQYFFEDQRTSSGLRKNNHRFIGNDCFI